MSQDQKHKQNIYNRMNNIEVWRNHTHKDRNADALMKQKLPLCAVRVSAKMKREAPSNVWSFQALRWVSHNTFVWSLDGASQSCVLKFQTYTLSSSLATKQMKKNGDPKLAHCFGNLRGRGDMIFCYKNQFIFMP